MKKLVFCITVLMLYTAMCLAQTEKTHTIMRGETLESVAKKYGIPLEDLKKANPGAEKVYYVGMSLIIPKISENKQAVAITEDKPTEVIAPTNNPTNSHEKKGMYALGGSGTVIGDFAFHFLMPADDILRKLYDGFNLGFCIDFGYRYYIHNNFFAEGMLGYRNFTLSRKKPSMHFNSHCITIPIHVGGLIPITEKAGIAALFGPRLDIPVSTKVEEGTNSQNVEGTSVGITLDFGIDLKFTDWAIRVQYLLGLGGDKSVSKNINGVSVGVNYGF